MSDEEVDSSWLETPDAAEEGSLSITSEDGTETKAQPASPYALKLDPWGKRKGKDLMKTKEFNELGNQTEEAAADMFGMAFEYEPNLVEQCADEKRLNFLKAMQEDADYQALHNSTHFDTLASELAALEFAKSYTAYKEKQEQREKQNPPGDGPPSPQEQLRQEMQAAVAAQAAAQAATQEVKELNDMRESMGIGQGGGGGGSMNADSVRQVFKKIRSNHQLKQICELAGKYKNVARSKQRAKVIHGYDDLIGVMLDNEPDLLVPSELALLGVPELQTDWYRRFAERQMFCDEYQAVEKVAKGPFIVSIDESGSMGGSKIAHAKAIGLTMAWLAREQKRWCGLHAWSDHPAADRILALPPKQWPTHEVMNWLTGFMSGGTQLPIEQIPKIYERLGASKGKTDVIIITDGDTGTLAPGAIAKFKAWKKQVNAKVIGISIASNCPALREVSEEYHQVSSLSVNNEAVGEVLSL